MSENIDITKIDSQIVKERLMAIQQLGSDICKEGQEHFASDEDEAKVRSTCPFGDWLLAYDVMKGGMTPALRDKIDKFVAHLKTKYLRGADERVSRWIKRADAHLVNPTPRDIWTAFGLYARAINLNRGGLSVKIANQEFLDFLHGRKDLR